MPLSGSDVMGGLISGGAMSLSDGFLGDSVKNMMTANVGVVQLLLAALIVLVLWCMWKKKEGFGEGGKNVERQTMDQSYFVPPTEYLPAAMHKEGMSGRSAEGQASYAAQSVGGGGSGVTSLSDLMDQQARAKFLADNQCNKAGTPYMGDPWTWLVDAARAPDTEGYMGMRENFRVSEKDLAVPGADGIGGAQY